MQMENLIRKNVMPIVVGGTNYYIEALLWKILIDNPKSDGESDEDLCVNDRLIEETSNQELHDRLKKVDPEMAEQLHPNNRRKVIR